MGSCCGCFLRLPLVLLGRLCLLRSFCREQLCCCHHHRLEVTKQHVLSGEGGGMLRWAVAVLTQSTIGSLLRVLVNPSPSQENQEEPDKPSFIQTSHDKRIFFSCDVMEGIPYSMLFRIAFWSL